MATLSSMGALGRPQVRRQRKCEIPEPMQCRSNASADNRFVPELVRIAQALDVALRSLKAELGRTPTIDEIGVRVGASREQIIEGLEVRAAINDRIANLSFEGQDLRNAVRDLLPRLSPRSRHVVQLRVFENQSSAEIAKSTGMSAAHVSRLLDEAMRYCVASMMKRT
jgi:RNA polymerase sigma factor (sigma-70 family)